MILFEEPGTAFLFGIVLAVIFFAIQLLLCFKVQKAVLKLLPLWFLLLCGFLLLPLGAGVFGTGSGFLGNVGSIVALILGMIIMIAFAGVASAWIFYGIFRKIKKQTRYRSHDGEGRICR